LTEDGETMTWGFLGIKKFWINIILRHVRCVEFNSEIGLGSIKLKVKNTIYECDSRSVGQWELFDQKHKNVVTSNVKIS